MGWLINRHYGWIIMQSENWNILIPSMTIPTIVAQMMKIVWILLWVVHLDHRHLALLDPLQLIYQHLIQLHLVDLDRLYVNLHLTLLGMFIEKNGKIADIDVASRNNLLLWIIGSLFFGHRSFFFYLSLGSFVIFCFKNSFLLIV